MARRDKELYLERDKALYEAYKKARKELYESLGDSEESMSKIHSLAIRKAINTRQSRFWISQDRTNRIILGLIKGDKFPKTWKTRLKMQSELLNTYNRLKEKRMFRGMSTRFIASFATFEPASGFFMSYSRAQRAIYRQYMAHKLHKQ